MSDERGLQHNRVHMCVSVHITGISFIACNYIGQKCGMVGSVNFEVKWMKVFHVGGVIMRHFIGSVRENGPYCVYQWARSCFLKGETSPRSIKWQEGRFHVCFWITNRLICWYHRVNTVFSSGNYAGRTLITF